MPAARRRLEFDMSVPFVDRREAGRELAESLQGFADRRDVLVLALPRGGVPVGFEIAQALRVPMDLLLVRKLGVPGQEELALGAIASGGARVLNRGVIEHLGITPDVIEAVTRREQRELERRERVYRGDRPRPDVAGRTIILVDDGLATGASMRAAAAALRQQQPGHIVVAVPVAPASTVRKLGRDPGVDRVVCLASPAGFGGVGQWYLDFGQVTDEQVRETLARAWHTPAPSG